MCLTLPTAHRHVVVYQSCASYSCYDLGPNSAMTSSSMCLAELRISSGLSKLLRQFDMQCALVQHTNTAAVMRQQCSWSACQDMPVMHAAQLLSHGTMVVMCACWRSWPMQC